MDDETVLDLGRRGYRIIQPPDIYRFGMDSVLLAHFAKVKPKWRALDLCCGSGIIPLLMHARCPQAVFSGIELDGKAADAANRSVKLNGLEKEICIVQGDVKHTEGLFNKESFDAITVNPPYFPLETGKEAAAPVDVAARHESQCTLEDVIIAAHRLLRFGGRFYIVHRPERLADIINCVRQYNLEPKTLRTVHSFPGKKASLILMSAIKGARQGLVIETPLVVYKKPGVFSEELNEIYYNKTEYTFHNSNGGITMADLKGSKTEANLMAAFAGESQARNKYTYYASKAKQEGYEQIAAIFNETADNEKEHAKLWFKLLHGGAVPGTVDNLKDAASGEHYEWTEMYAQFAEEAKKEGFDKIAALFQGVAAIEHEHENRYNKLSANIENKEVFSHNGEVVWTCTNCGHVHKGSNAPEICPVCSHPQGFFQIKSVNY